MLGALDNVLHHEITERLPSKPSARRELQLHSAREAIYAVLFLIFAWIEPGGIFAAAVLALLLSKWPITIADFLEEDRTRHLPPFERVLHTVLAVLYGTFLGLSLSRGSSRRRQSPAASPSSRTACSRGSSRWQPSASSLSPSATPLPSARLANIAAAKRAPQSAERPHAFSSPAQPASSARALVERLLARGDRVFVLARDARQSRALFGDSVHHVERLDALPRETRIDAIVNLAGAPVIGLPWTRARRAQLWRSRIDLTDGSIAWIKTLDHVPAVLVNASAIGFYGDKGDDVLAENARRRAGLRRRSLPPLGRRSTRAPKRWACASFACASASCSTQAAARCR